MFAIFSKSNFRVVARDTFLFVVAERKAVVFLAVFVLRVLVTVFVVARFVDVCVALVCAVVRVATFLVG